MAQRCRGQVRNQLQVLGKAGNGGRRIVWRLGFGAQSSLCCPTARSCMSKPCVSRRKRLVSVCPSTDEELAALFIVCCAFSSCLHFAGRGACRSLHLEDASGSGYVPVSLVYFESPLAPRVSRCLAQQRREPAASCTVGFCQGDVAHFCVFHGRICELKSMCLQGEASCRAHSLQIL